MRRKTLVFLTFMVVVMVSVAIPTLFISSPLKAQLNPTEQQQTVDAVIQQYFNATATAAAVVNPATQTAVFEQTLMAAFQQAQTATAQTANIAPTATRTPIPAVSPTVMGTRVLSPALTVQRLNAAGGQTFFAITATGLMSETSYSVLFTHVATNDVRQSTTATTDTNGQFILRFTIGGDDPSGNYTAQIRRLGTLIVEEEFQVAGTNNNTNTGRAPTSTPEPRPGKILTEALRTLRGQGSAFDFDGWKRDVLIDYHQEEISDDVNYIQWSYVSERIYRSFVLAGEVQYDDSPLDGSCGFVYYDNDTNNTHYATTLNRNRNFTWDMQLDGYWSQANYTFTPENTFVYDGEQAINEWFILVDDGQMVVLINGGMIAYMVDFTIMSGKVGMSAGTPSYSDQNTCIFRDVEVWIPG